MQNKRGRNRSFSLNNFLPENRRGQELSTTAIILIILGVLVLVVLIVGFSLGWNRIAPWLSRDNVNQVVDACNNACTTKSVYDFCLRKREVIAEGDKYVSLTCNYMANKMKSDTQKDIGVSCTEALCTNIVFRDAIAVVATSLECGTDKGNVQAYRTHNNTLQSITCA